MLLGGLVVDLRFDYVVYLVRLCISERQMDSCSSLTWGCNTLNES